MIRKEQINPWMFSSATSSGVCGHHLINTSKWPDFYIGNEYPQSGSQSYCCFFVFFFQRRKKAALKRALFFPLGPPVRIQSLPLMWLWGTHKALITDSRYHNNTTLFCALVCFFPTSLSFWLAACKTSAFIGRKLNSIYKVGTFIWNW